MKPSSFLRAAIACTVVPAFLAACGPAEVARGINDPYEDHNRAIHQANRQIDRAVLRPVSGGYGGVPEPVKRGVGNFAGNVELPRSIVNDILQANIEDAAHNLTRFLINTTIGIAGILDPASSMGLHARPSDFGETLHVWGASEGHYVELPLLGPSTKRDAIGRFVDFFTNPLSYVLPSPERLVVPASAAISTVGDRSRFATTIDSILYESADSYAQARLLYLQNRRFELGQEPPEEEIDPFAIDTEGF